MNRNLAEMLLLVSVAINAALLTFIAGVLRKVMNEMGVNEFQQFLTSFYRHSVRSPFMIAALNLPLVGAVPYFYFYGFGNRWIVAGIALWLVAGGIAKAIKLPIYKAVSALEREDVAGLERERRKLNGGNVLQAVLDCVAAALMVVPFVGR